MFRALITGGLLGSLKRSIIVMPPLPCFIIQIFEKLIPEPYVSYKCSLSLFNKCGEFENIKVPEDHFLVLGDNRANSWDGRYWPGSKFLHKEEIIGKAYFRFWPLSEVGFFNK